MNDRERLIELLGTYYVDYGAAVSFLTDQECEDIADHILASGFIEEKQNEAYDVGVDSALHHHFGLSWEDAAGLRKKVERIKDASRWIPVTERLPETTRRCIVSKHNVPFLAWWTGKDWRAADTVTVVDGINYWIELPQPPKEES